MARYENKKPNRSGSVFTNDRGSIISDLSSVRFLFRGVDTIRQLYNCSVRPEIFDAVTKHWETAKDDVIILQGMEFKLSSSGKAAGYKYILKNLEAGVIVLFKSMYCEADKQGPHIKIEATPQLIQELGLQKLTNYLRQVASIFADTLEASGVAVHLACDFKGWEPPQDFESNLVTRSKRNLRVNALTAAHNQSVSEVALVYGQGQTYMFGESGSLQFCLYEKSAEAIKSRKLEFCESLWSQVPSVDDPSKPEYNDGSDGTEADTVRRVEFRIHQSVIKEFEHGHFNVTQQLDEKGNIVSPGVLCSIREARDLIPHLQGLWEYCLNNFRYQYSTTYVHPLWSMLSDDVEWFGFAEGWTYKRSQKKSVDGVSNRNVAMWLGNWLRIAAAKGLKTSFVVNQIMSAGADSMVADYFGVRLYGNTNEVVSLLTEFVEKRMRDHRLNGVGGLNVA